MNYKRVEDELLVLLCDEQLSRINGERIIGMLKGKIEWDYFIMSCFINKVNNCVYINIIDNDYDKFIKYPIITLLQRTFCYSSIRLKNLYEEMECVCRHFNSNRINYALIKGFSLSEVA